MNPVLDQILSRYASIAVAYSGGVDSAVLMEATHRSRGDCSFAVLADSPSLPRKEFESAVALAKSQKWNLVVIQTEEFQDARYMENPSNRCYFCKSALFEKMDRFAIDRQVEALAYGENADDALEERWGRKAASEFKVIAPLREAGFTKSQVRALAREWNLPVAEKVASPCLSSRVQTGIPITSDSLIRIEKGEEFLGELGFRIRRVRFDGKTARVMVSENELPELLKTDKKNRVIDFLNEIGFEKIEISEEPYRGASLR
ncbi:MAG: ATP-dependent sacrificial sulfur transferase LarE [Verrucomicrobiota bacterium]